MEKPQSINQHVKDLLHREIEKPVLEQLYIAHGVATDQLRRDPETLCQITDAFNHITGQRYDSSTLLRYMINRRKQSDWPRLGTRATKFDSVLNLLSPDQIAVLRQIYLELDIPSDQFLYEPQLIRDIANRFTGLSGTSVPGTTLVAVIIAKRKRGLWVKIREPFVDIEEVAS